MEWNWTNFIIPLGTLKSLYVEYQTSWTNALQIHLYAVHLSISRYSRKLLKWIWKVRSFLSKKYRSLQKKLIINVMFNIFIERYNELRLKTRLSGRVSKESWLTTQWSWVYTSSSNGDFSTFSNVFECPLPSEICLV